MESTNAFSALKKTGRIGLQIDIFKSGFYEPNFCISSYLEILKYMGIPDQLTCLLRNTRPHFHKPMETLKILRFDKQLCVLYVVLKNSL